MVKAAWDDLQLYPLGGVAVLTQFFDAFWNVAVSQERLPESSYASDAARMMVGILSDLRWALTDALTPLRL